MLSQNYFLPVSSIISFMYITFASIFTQNFSKWKGFSDGRLVFEAGELYVPELYMPQECLKQLLLPV